MDKPRVLLIDEIDKSDIDLPNDLLHILEEGKFDIPELFRIAKELETVQVQTAYTDDKEPTYAEVTVPITRGHVRCREFPLTILTSNGERDFPPAFLRRCLRLDLKEPTFEFKVATILAVLQAFSFQVASIEIESTGFFRRTPRLVVKRQQQQAWSFTEVLGSGVSLEMVNIPAGSFLMGSPQDESERSDSEGPQHEVNIQSFFLGKYTVTQTQWKVVAVLPQVKRVLTPDPSHFKGDNRPVESVSWLDAVEFCDRLSHLTGKLYRLPSEAAWEYACRAGTTTPFHFGETITTDLANYNGNTYKDGPKGEFHNETTPIFFSLLLVSAIKIF